MAAGTMQCPPRSASMPCIMYGISGMEPLWQSEHQIINLRWATGSKWTVKRRRKRARENLREKVNLSLSFQLWVVTQSSLCIITPKEIIYLSATLSIYYSLPFYLLSSSRYSSLNPLVSTDLGPEIKPENVFVIYQSHHVISGAIFCSKPGVTFDLIQHIVIE